uniref:NADAR domain-containing protein n=1 Tax=Globodera rostochiensis TaxID=31243 RepID=A0A914HZS6_GLORO
MFSKSNLGQKSTKRNKITWNPTEVAVTRRSSTQKPETQKALMVASISFSSFGMSHEVPRRTPLILTELDGCTQIAPFFTNAFGFSNHFACRFTVDGLEFCCTEQFYMYYKARIFGDEGSAVAILRSRDPKAIKQFGAQIRLFDTALWRKVSILTKSKNVMGRLLTRIRDTFKEREQYQQEWEEVVRGCPNYTKTPERVQANHLIG